ncbi:hypothetical protein BJF93_01695 [Xaviernesmea oryzae]|uniref:AraC family transcriptional regulator n=1 Tax=Xaviernesmea oryzae TaxID=464029 RepID=A0A1Q9B399_9HYPH|nr:hypothetical protein [Xaviernesmea oryzae]OLP62535.1 hypothetical protein BJF93_01695 [Xaviernesmea oryzae]SEM20327.1 hypothetical protein SAMN04487976_12259 [Xaviernesmea oryzae]
MTSQPYEPTLLFRCFGLRQAPCLSIAPLAQALLASAHLHVSLGGRADCPIVIAPQPAYLMMAYRQDAWHCDVAADGTRAPVRLYPRGSICLVDLREGASIILHSDLDAMAFIIPESLLDEIADFAGEPAAPLLCQRGQPDTVIACLVMAWASLMQAATRSDAVLRHTARAICLHLVHAYGPAMAAAEVGAGQIGRQPTRH